MGDLFTIDELNIIKEIISIPFLYTAGKLRKTRRKNIKNRNRNSRRVLTRFL